MSEPKKVSLNQETAASTEKHNDRTMYRRGYDERANNVHWDMYDCGSSFEAEARYYTETFGEVLQAQNERAIAMRKYERVMDMPTWHSKHMPKEAIVQLGCVGNNDDVKDYAIEAAKKMRERIESLGGVVISWDVHDDEYTKDEETGELIKGTPHAHIRYLFTVDDKNGMPKIDMKNALLQAGVEPPDPSKEIGRGNNPSQTFLDGCRDMLEDYADEYELARKHDKVDRSRTSRPHQTIAVYKARKQAEAALERAAAAEAREADALARVEAMQRTLEDTVAERDKAIEERDAAIADKDAAVERRNKAEKSRKLIEGETFRRNGEPMLGVAGLEKERKAILADIETKKSERDELEVDIKRLSKKRDDVADDVKQLEDKKANIPNEIEAQKQLQIMEHERQLEEERKATIKRYAALKFGDSSSIREKIETVIDAVAMWLRYEVFKPLSGEGFAIETAPIATALRDDDRKRDSLRETIAKKLDDEAFMSSSSDLPDDIPRDVVREHLTPHQDALKIRVADVEHDDSVGSRSGSFGAKRMHDQHVPTMSPNRSRGYDSPSL